MASLSSRLRLAWGLPASRLVLEGDSQGAVLPLPGVEHLEVTDVDLRGADQGGHVPDE